MTHLEIKTLFRLLLLWEDEDFGDMKAFLAGEWSRDNLQAMIDDIGRAGGTRPLHKPDMETKDD